MTPIREGQTAVRVKTAAHVLAVVAACLVGALIALSTFGLDRRLDIGTVHVSVDPGHRGALDLYVPLVDWGVRFDGVRLPARLRVDVRSIDRRRALEVASARELDVERLRADARDAIASYLRLLVLVTFAAALALGALVALALHRHPPPRLRWLFAAAGATAAVCALAVALLLPPRGDLGAPEYYAHGPDIPRALTALRAASASAGVLSDELNAQLVGLARFVSDPAGRGGVDGLPRLTIASDLHNNVLALPAIENAANGGPLLFAGDLTDTGTALELRLVRRVVEAGDPVVFVTGNHDSDTLARRLAREGAIVLTERGRIRPDGHLGERVVTVRGLRIAGYADPFAYRRDNEAGPPRREPHPTPAMQRDFADWLRPLVGKIDVVMVHNPTLAELALEELREHPPDRELLLVVGHTHRPAVERDENVTVVNGGTAGGGGTGNLTEGQPVGLAVLSYRARRGFTPVAVDTVEVDPSSGSARAERRPLDREDTDDDEARDRRLEPRAAARR